MNDRLAQPPIRRGNLWKHQLEAYHFSLNREAVMLNMWMGVGKSRVVVDLLENLNIDKTLILCPKSVLGVWRREFAKFGQPGRKIYILDKGSGKNNDPDHSDLARPL